MLRLPRAIEVTLVMIYRYFILLIATTALLVGIQAPNLLTQYQQRLAAQYAEAMVYYRDYQALADRHYQGDLQRLIEAHRQSNEPAFQEEAAIIEKLVTRVALFEQQLQLHQQSYPAQLWALAWQNNEELLQGTLTEYSFNVPLNQRALATGALFALAVAVLIDLLWAASKRLFTRRRTFTNVSGRRP
ncbi:MAG: hypothetical protein CMF22_08500 [Idiomarinaceae bacterium]|uniref:DUF2937 domain-containing protein n=1 Tax=Pseudidiomarina aquimaris TaxID=641841 RepID=A0A432XPZ1_9GAMM|nr:DUF2937 family protein [Pseudidiomarina aquimaris]MBG23481.1 hypothetical protein [Idiomarinaceae bacterium]RUO50758.1 hypothetical protein CWE21_01240 [Pseudidiomarina aquimaris]